MKYWLYYILKAFFLFFPFRTIYRRVYIDGLEHIPKDKPILICSNHPNSFLDGICYEYFLRRKVFTLVRGDVFKKPIVNKLLRSMLLLPIFRPRDVKASEARTGNSKTLSECVKLFKKNNAILIFSEGDAFPEKRLRPIKNGTLKLASDCYNECNQELDLYLVPAGINYQKLHGVGGAIHLSFGEPIRLKNHKEQINADLNQFRNQQRSFLSNEISNLVVHTEGEEKPERELLQEMFLNELIEFPLLTIKNAKANLIAEKIVKVMLDKEKSKLVTAYHQNLKELNISDKIISNNSLDFVAFFVALFTMTLSFPFFIIHFLGQYVFREIIHKKIKNVIFWDSILYGSVLILFILSVFSFLSYFLYTEGIKWGIIYWLFSIVGGYMWFRVYWDLSYVSQILKRLFLPKNKIKQLIEQRKEILNSTN